jgi:hypothetical protein
MCRLRGDDTDSLQTGHNIKSWKRAIEGSGDTRFEKIVAAVAAPLKIE